MGVKAVEEPSVEEYETVAVEKTSQVEQNEQDTEADSRAALLISMGFSVDEVAGALAATWGSLERAADWLFVARAEAKAKEEAAEEEFPAEWDAIVLDLKEMGFEETPAKNALKQVNGEMKEAVKALVS